MINVLKKSLVIIAVLMLTFTLAGCASSVAGKTYVLDSFDSELTEGLGTLEELAAKASIEATKLVYNNIEITFNEDGTCTLGAWTQEGSKLTMAGTEYKVSGNKIILKVEKNDYKLKVVLKAK